MLDIRVWWFIRRNTHTIVYLQSNIITYWLKSLVDISIFSSWWKLKIIRHTNFFSINKGSITASIFQEGVCACAVIFLQNKMILAFKYMYFGILNFCPEQENKYAVNFKSIAKINILVLWWSALYCKSWTHLCFSSLYIWRNSRNPHLCQMCTAHLSCLLRNWNVTKE